MHVPPAHCCVPPLHVFPGIPQLFGLVCRSTHAVPTFVRPGAQSHVPALQNEPSPMQSFMQAPQLRGSSFKSVHVSLPPHGVRLGSVQPHFPVAQTPNLVSQSFPHAPQFVGSDDVSIHIIPHIIAPGLHAHCPDVQMPPLPQASPHLPQLFASDETSVQISLHATCPAGHWQRSLTQLAPAGHCIPPQGTVPELDELLLELLVDAPPTPPPPDGSNWSKSWVQLITSIAGKMKLIRDVFCIPSNHHHASVASSMDAKCAQVSLPQDENIQRTLHLAALVVAPGNGRP